MLQVSRNVSFGGGGKAPLNKEEVKQFLLNFALVDEKLLSFFNNNDFIPTTVLDYCTEMDQPFLNVLLRGNSQLARQA